MHRRLRVSFAVLVVALGGGLVGGAWGQSPPSPASVAAEPWGTVTRVPAEPTAHRVWVNDRVLRHSLLFDADTGRMLGAVDSATALSARPPYLAPDRGELYVIETFYSRGLRGARSDQVAIYDDETLAVIDEVAIPARSADTGQGVALGAVLDAERFLVVLNQSPASSVSVVDLRERRFVEEVVTGGCSMVYAVDAQRFGMLCGDGTALLVELDEEGRKRRTVASEPFFDVVQDPITVAGVRDGSTWYFASFEGWLYEVDFSGETPVARAPWSLFSEAEREAGWRIGGVQHLAFHRASRRLFSIVHQGGPGSHKEPGPEIWVYDVDARKRRRQIEAPNVLVPFVRPFLEIEGEGFAASLLRWVLPSPGVHTIAVTQDETPLLFARNVDLGAVGVLDARTGEHVGDLEEVGLSGPMLVVP